MSALAGIAAVDLGSNSFHMVIARLVGGEPVILDRLREQVQLGAGIDDDRRLRPEVAERALRCLERFGQRLRDVPGYRVRAVGTNALRVARDSAAFVEAAEKALGVPIDVVAGLEEARLIYLGVSHSLASTDPSTRLVMDIGGGSTEVILGHGFDVEEAHSFDMGCVSFSERFFAGAVDRASYSDAVLAARGELQTIAQRFVERGWEMAIGASGTVRAVDKVLHTNGWAERGITARGMRKLRKALCAQECSADRLELPGLERERASVFPGGAAILHALVEAFHLDRLSVSTGSMREGVLYDLLGRLRHEDVRERTVRAFQQRYDVDVAQAGRVERTVQRLWDSAAAAWSLDQSERHDVLCWAARLHEIGLAVSWRHQHRHGGYLIEHSYMPGFARNEQRALAALVALHRRRVDQERLDLLPPAARPAVARLTVLLRLAVLLNRSRSPRPPRIDGIEVGGDRLTLHLPASFEERHPLTMADLREEIDLVRPLGVKLRLRTADQLAAVDEGGEA